MTIKQLKEKLNEFSDDMDVCIMKTKDDDKRLSFAEAKRLGIKKWQKHVKAGGESYSIYRDEELNDLIFYCGFCERHSTLIDDGRKCVDCTDCEFGKVAGICEEGSLYINWCKDSSLENAQKILDVIENLEETK